MSEFNDGGLADRSAGRVGGGVNMSGAGGGSRTNFNSGYRPGTGYGVTPFNVPRRDQTLQDRQFGTLGGGMVGTSFGGGGAGDKAGLAAGGTATKVPVPQTMPPVKVPYAAPVPGVAPVADPLVKPPKFADEWNAGVPVANPAGAGFTAGRPESIYGQISGTGPGGMFGGSSYPNAGYNPSTQGNTGLGGGTMGRGISGMVR